MRTKRRLSIAFAIAALAAAAPASSGHADTTGPVAIAAKSCSAGYVHAVTPGGHKCLRAGQFCSHGPGYSSVYRRAGYVCASNGHLRYR